MSVLERCTVVLDEVLSDQAAGRVADALTWMRQGGALQIDLTKARPIDDVGLAELVRLLRTRGEEVKVRILGLSRRDRRMLEYLGLDLAVAVEKASLASDH
jgi:anti-anti-sigma regulatory factor